MIKEHRPGSAMVYEPNPTYWRKTVVNGKEYQLPFIEELIIPIIMDYSTRLAALRTAQLDICQTIRPMNHASLIATSPEMEVKYYAFSAHPWISLRMDRPPFDNMRVRQAIAMATDPQVWEDGLYYMADKVNWWPVGPSAAGVFTPLEDQPEVTQKMFGYYPEEAKQILAEEGYPDGFSTSIMVRGESGGDAGSLLKDMWKQAVNVDVDITIEEAGDFARRTALRDFPQDCVWLNGPWEQYMECTRMHYLPGEFHNLAFYDNPYVTEQFNLAMTTTDKVAQDALMKEVINIVLEEGAFIPTGMQKTGNFYWPWIKNYSGEISHGRAQPPFALMWLDLDLKAEMGY